MKLDQLLNRLRSENNLNCFSISDAGCCMIVSMILLFPIVLYSTEGVASKLEENEKGSKTFAEEMNSVISRGNADLISLRHLVVDISGTVTDAEDEPLIGVNVLVKGTDKGTATDFDGSFSLTDVDEEAVLVFSYVGYETQEIPVEGRSSIDVIMVSDAELLEEVVVIGYGTQRRSAATGAISSANIEDFRDMPNTNIAQSLQGTVPGLNIGQVNSAGQTPGISIRGKTTISGSTDVLIILDGIPFTGSLSSLNPDDIESIDVLKDASSTAVYGAQAANGVILITTRRGRTDEPPRVVVSSSYSSQTPSKNFRPMRREGYLEHIRELFWDEAFLPPDYVEPNPDFDLVSKVDPIMKDSEGNLLENDFDWWDEATHRGEIKEINASLSGGSEKINYLISLGITDQSAFIKNDYFQRKNVRINLESDPLDWVKLGIESFGSFVNEDGAEPTMAEIIRQSPLLVPYDEEGNLIPNPFNTLDKNPFLSYDVNDYDRKNYFFANIFSEIDFPFLEGLRYRVNFGNNLRINQHFYASEYGAGLTGNAYKNYGSYNDYTLDNIVYYDRIFGQHSVRATLLYGASERKYNFTSSSAEGFSRLNLGYHKLQEGNLQFSESNAWREGLLYQMARINYEFDDRYLVTATVRRDGFSGFAENNKYGIFPSVAVGWVVSEEAFFHSDFIDRLKLRIGYGTSGNQTSRYKSLAQLTTRPTYVFGDGGSTAFGQQIVSMANPNLRWEKTVGINAGVDFDIINHRIDGSIDFYNDITNDLLFDVSIPQITGVGSISTNLGKLQNYGLEFSINSENIKSSNFQWNSTFVFSTNRNKIIELLGKDEEGEEEDLIASGLFIGHSLGTIYHYETDGLYQIDDEIPAGYNPGNYRIVDQNGDGKIDSDDRVILGKTEPAYRFSIWNKFHYKNFTLGIFINSIQGGKNSYLGNNVRPLVRNDNNIRYNYFEGMDYWLPSNPDAHNPRSVTTPAISPNIFMDRSFIRLQDLNLSYDFGGSFLERTPINNLSVYFSAKNLYTWTDWKGWDPETNQGLTISGRPVLRSYSVGFNVTI